MAFTIKVAKLKKRGKAGIATLADLCNDDHCTSASSQCTKPSCCQRLHQTLQQLKHENLALSLAYDTRHAR